MAGKREDGTKWLKFGCLGCLGVLALGVVLLLSLGGIAWMRAQSQQVEEQVLSPEVPPAPGAPEAPGGSLPAEEVLEPVVPPPVQTTGRVFLDLSDTDFRIEPGRPGEPLRVEATYDKTSYELTEQLETPEDGGWIYRVRFRRKAPSILVTLTELISGNQPRVRIVLPVDVPLALDFDLSEGGSELELGGLWLISAELDFRRGGFQVSVEEPLRAPMDHLLIRGSMGGFATSGLGNASPRRLDVDFSMGGMELDLRGRWAQDSDISVRSSMGGGVIRLPRNVLIKGLDVARRSPGSDQEVPPPTLTFTTSMSMGELEIIP